MGEWDEKKKALDALRRPGCAPSTALVVSVSRPVLSPVRPKRKRKRRKLTASEKSRNEALKSLRTLVAYSKKCLDEAAFRHRQYSQALAILKHGLPKEMQNAYRTT